MSVLDDARFVDQAQLKQVMLANADKTDKRYLKKVDAEAFAKTEDLGDLAYKDKVTAEDLDAALAGVIDAKADAVTVYTKDEVDTKIDNVVDGLGDLASLDKVSEEELSDALKNRINNTYTKNEVYTKEETYTKTEVDSAIDTKVSRAYKIAGSVEFADLPDATPETIGYVYDVIDEFITDERFLHPGIKVGASTNVVVVITGDPGEEEYKYDVLSSTIDLSDYVRREEIVVASAKDIQDIIDSIYEGMDTDDSEEVVDFVISSDASFAEIAAFAKQEGVTTVKAKLNNDLTVPSREDGRITTTFLSDPVDVILDLNGHNVSVDAYAFYVTNGTLTIKDSTGEGKIQTRILDKTYPAVYCEGGKVVMESGLIDTRVEEVPEGHYNYTYGVVAAKDGTIEVKGGEIHTDAASCLSICNGQASGAGANFIVSGNAVLKTDNCAAIYLADNKNLIIKDNAIVDGGIIARMGNIEIRDNAKVINNLEYQDDFGEYLVSSGVIAAAPAVLLMAGCYNTNTESNELDLTISGNATVESSNGEAVYVARLDTLYAQEVRVNVQDSTKLTAADGFDKVKVAEHDELAAIAAASGKTMKAKSVVTDVEVTVDGEVIYNKAD